MEDAYIGSIALFAGNFEPRNWKYCNGQTLPISDFSPLFAILGTTYGGDGRTTFSLPDLRGRVPVHVGTGPGLTHRSLGEKSGQEYVTLSQNEIPSHTHQVVAKFNAAEEANTADPTNNFIAGTGAPAFSTTKDAEMNNNAVEIAAENSGGNQSHYNMQPYLGLNYIICVQGLFPSRS